MGKYDGMTVSEVLRQKKASIRTAPLPPGSPSWSELEPMRWEAIESGARQNLPGYKTVRKLLTDQRFDR
ncbi:MAG: hypothetical protein ACAI43_25815 [Phycisphaerae bacterium]|nr:hypothetical protein [Tepidisphaeraceae bacterium]